MSDSSFPKDGTTVRTAIDSLADRLLDLLDDATPVVMIGIRRGGAVVATELGKSLARHDVLEVPTPGELNIAFYRDDFGSRGLHPVVGPSNVPFDIDGRQVVLVDDVLASGRTVRAAMNEIFDFGRPASIVLTVLVERDNRELPIRADLSAWQVSLPPQRHVELDGDTLELRVVDR